MQIDLTKLSYLDSIDIDSSVDVPKEYYLDTEIEKLKNINVTGNIIYDNDNYVVNLKLMGTMMLHDSVSYDIIPYEFSVNIEESLEKSLKTLDLIPFLWHYIILEIPLRCTKCEDSSVEKENYRIISEEEYKKKCNPFGDFKIE